MRRPISGSTRVVRSGRGSERVDVCSMEVVGGGHTDPRFLGPSATRLPVLGSKL